MESFDTQKLIAKVAARHGILLKANDAAFALVTMNQIVLAETLKAADNDIRVRVEALEIPFRRSSGWLVKSWLKRSKHQPPPHGGK